MGRLSCTWCVCGRFCEAKRTLLQCLSDVFAALNGCVCGAFSAQNGRVCDVFGVFVFIVQLVEGHFFCLLNGASFLYLACLWMLLRRKTGAFTMSFGRVRDVKRFFGAKRTTCLRSCQNTDCQCYHPIGQWAETRANMSRHVRVHDVIVNICERPRGQWAELY